MGSDKWLTATIDEIKASIPHSTALGPFGSTIRAENFVLTGVPVIRGLNLNAERFKDDGFVFIADKKADELDSANAFPDDLVFVYIGSIGQVGIIPSNSSYSRYITHGSVISRLVLKNQHRAGHTALATSPRVLRGAVAPPTEA